MPRPAVVEFGILYPRQPTNRVDGGADNNGNDFDTNFNADPNRNVIGGDASGGPLPGAPIGNDLGNGPIDRPAGGSGGGGIGAPIDRPIGIPGGDADGTFGGARPDEANSIDNDDPASFGGGGGIGSVGGIGGNRDDFGKIHFASSKLFYIKLFKRKNLH